MNERDLKLVKVLDSEIEMGSSSMLYLISAKYTNLVRVNLVLLKVMLDEKGRKGIMITIDRPHQYVSHLLQLHGIDQARLTFVDAISSHSSDTKAGAVAAEFRRGPFQIETLPEFLSGENGGSHHIPSDFGDAEFIVMDNVSTLLTYNTMDSVRSFFSRYVQLVMSKRSGHMVTTIVMDKDLHPALYQYVSGLARMVIELAPDMQVVRVSPGGIREGTASGSEDGIGSKDVMDS